MSLVDYLVEAVTPSRRVRSDEHFWKRYSKSMLKDQEISDLLNGIKDPKDKEKAVGTLSNIVKKNYKTQGETYFNQGPNIARYGALALGVIGGITAAGAFLALAAGAPLTAIGAVSAGLATVAYGGITATAADVYDSKKAQQAIDGKLKPEKQTKGTLGYVKKVAQKGWDIISTPFNPRTYKSLYHNVGDIGLGLALRSMAYWGGGYAPVALGPWGQIAPLFTSLVDFYSGRKKFDDKVIQKIKEESLKEFKVKYGLEDVVKDDVQKPFKQPGDRKIIPIRDDYSHAAYSVLEKQRNPYKAIPLGYVAPRKQQKAA